MFSVNFSRLASFLAILLLNLSLSHHSFTLKNAFFTNCNFHINLENIFRSVTVFWSAMTYNSWVKSHQPFLLVQLNYFSAYTCKPAYCFSLDKPLLFSSLPNLCDEQTWLHHKHQDTSWRLYNGPSIPDSTTEIKLHAKEWAYRHLCRPNKSACHCECSIQLGSNQYVWIQGARFCHRRQVQGFTTHLYNQHINRKFDSNSY